MICLDWDELLFLETEAAQTLLHFLCTLVPLWEVLHDNASSIAVTIISSATACGVRKSVMVLRWSCLRPGTRCRGAPLVVGVFSSPFWSCYRAETCGRPTAVVAAILSRSFRTSDWAETRCWGLVVSIGVTIGISRVSPSRSPLRSLFRCLRFPLFFTILLGCTAYRITCWAIAWTIRTERFDDFPEPINKTISARRLFIEKNATTPCVSFSRTIAGCLLTLDPLSSLPPLGLLPLPINKTISARRLFIEKNATTPCVSLSSRTIAGCLLTLDPLSSLPPLGLPGIVDRYGQQRPQGSLKMGLPPLRHSTNVGEEATRATTARGATFMIVGIVIVRWFDEHELLHEHELFRCHLSGCRKHCRFRIMVNALTKKTYSGLESGLVCPRVQFLNPFAPKF